METYSISVGKQRVGYFGKFRYYIQIDSVTDYYYSEYAMKKQLLIMKKCG